MIGIKFYMWKVHSLKICEKLTVNNQVFQFQIKRNEQPINLKLCLGNYVTMRGFRNIRQVVL